MAKYDLSHLTQTEKQDVLGPIQDDEALFLYSLIRVMRLKNIVELGGLYGYSALNFSKAIGKEGKIVTIDLTQTPKVGENHSVIVGDCSSVSHEMLNMDSIDLVFFDTHDYDSSMQFFVRMKNCGMITTKTILTLHDTGTHPNRFCNSYHTEQGFVHQPTERRMVNEFVEMGYHAFCLHTRLTDHNENFPFRHGLTVMSNFEKLIV